MEGVGITYFEKPNRDENIDDCQQNWCEIRKNFNTLKATSHSPIFDIPMRRPLREDQIVLPVKKGPQLA